MMPPIPIQPVRYRNTDNIKPFARIQLDLIRIYHLTPNCFEKPEEDDDEGDHVETENEDDKAGSEDESGDETEG